MLAVVCSISPLFSTGQDRVVETQSRGSKRLLCRHPVMDRAVIAFDSVRHDFCDVPKPTKLVNWIWRLKN